MMPSAGLLSSRSDVVGAMACSRGARGAPGHPHAERDPTKRRHFEISIDSPFHILSCKATQANIYLPDNLRKSVSIILTRKKKEENGLTYFDPVVDLNVLAQSEDTSKSP
jgi:hypothetical protein